MTDERQKKPSARKIRIKDEKSSDIALSKPVPERTKKTINHRGNEGTKPLKSSVLKPESANLSEAFKDQKGTKNEKPPKASILKSVAAKDSKSSENLNKSKVKKSPKSSESSVASKESSFSKNSKTWKDQKKMKDKKSPPNKKVRKKESSGRLHVQDDPKSSVSSVASNESTSSKKCKLSKNCKRTKEKKPSKDRKSSEVKKFSGEMQVQDDAKSSESSVASNVSTSSKKRKQPKNCKWTKEKKPSKHRKNATVRTSSGELHMQDDPKSSESHVARNESTPSKKCKLPKNCKRTKEKKPSKNRKSTRVEQSSGELQVQDNPKLSGSSVASNESTSSNKSKLPKNCKRTKEKKPAKNRKNATVKTSSGELQVQDDPKSSEPSVDSNKSTSSKICKLPKNCKRTREKKPAKNRKSTTVEKSSGELQVQDDPKSSESSVASNDSPFFKKCKPYKNSKKIKEREPSKNQKSTTVNTFSGELQVQDDAKSFESSVASNESNFFTSCERFENCKKTREREPSNIRKRTRDEKSSSELQVQDDAKSSESFLVSNESITYVKCKQSKNCKKVREKNPSKKRQINKEEESYVQDDFKSSESSVASTESTSPRKLKPWKKQKKPRDKKPSKNRKSTENEESFGEMQTQDEPKSSESSVDSNESTFSRKLKFKRKKIKSRKPVKFRERTEDKECYGELQIQDEYKSSESTLASNEFDFSEKSKPSIKYQTTSDREPEIVSDSKLLLSESDNSDQESLSIGTIELSEKSDTSEIQVESSNLLNDSELFESFEPSTNSFCVIDSKPSNGTISSICCRKPKKNHGILQNRTDDKLSRPKQVICKSQKSGDPEKPSKSVLLKKQKRKPKEPSVDKKLSRKFKRFKERLFPKLRRNSERTVNKVKVIYKNLHSKMSRKDLTVCQNFHSDVDNGSLTSSNESLAKNKLRSNEGYKKSEVEQPKQIPSCDKRSCVTSKKSPSTKSISIVEPKSSERQKNSSSQLKSREDHVSHKKRPEFQQFPSKNPELEKQNVNCRVYQVCECPENPNKPVEGNLYPMCCCPEDICERKIKRKSELFSHQKKKT